ncbi:MAG: hypothetical protein AAF607_05025 [Pseudomonadota bacterium]
MAFRVICLSMLALFASTAQLSGYYVRQEAVEMRALVRQVQADTLRLETLRTQELVLSRMSEIERWAGALNTLGPARPDQLQSSSRHVLAPRPRPRPRPKSPRAAPPASRATPIETLDDLIAELSL